MLKRRKFLKWVAAFVSVIISGCLGKDSIEKDKESIKEGLPLKRSYRTKIYIIKTTERTSGIKELLKSFNLGNLTGKKVALKANYNSADPFPASTHILTLEAIVDSLSEKGATIVLAERSGMGNTRDVLKKMGVTELAGKKGFDLVVLDDLKGGSWLKHSPEGGHWKKGFLFPKVFAEADLIVQTCCLKTHRFGGHFTMSLKNSVGMVAKYDPDDNYNYMSELHSSRYQRQMIAEINKAYTPEIVIMDGISGFSKGGPDTGTLIEPGIILAGNDRTALDAAGVAVLRIYGTTADVGKGKIFEQDQIARAVELDLGALSPDEIEIIPLNEEAKDICSQIVQKLKE